MELKVTVDGVVRVVCGVSEETTCQDIVIALARAMGRAGRFSLLEKWRNQERSLPPWEKPFLVLQKWGQYASDVLFVLQQTDTTPVTVTGKISTGPITTTTTTNNNNNTTTTTTNMASEDLRARNLSPVSSVQVQDSPSVKRSLTFSGAMYSSQEKFRPSRSQGRRSLPLKGPPQALAQAPSQSYPHHHHYQHTSTVKNAQPHHPHKNPLERLPSQQQQQQQHPQPQVSNQKHRGQQQSHQQQSHQHHQQQQQQPQYQYQQQPHMPQQRSQYQHHHQQQPHHQQQLQHQHQQQQQQPPQHQQQHQQQSQQQLHHQQQLHQQQHQHQPQSQQQLHHQQQLHQQQQPHQHQIFQNHHPTIQKPISSIKPQPKPRNLPLKPINEKQPVRTVGTVSPIQSHSGQLSAHVARQDLSSRVFNNNASRFNIQSGSPDDAGSKVSSNDDFYRKNHPSTTTTIKSSDGTSTTSSSSGSNNNHHGNNESGSNSSSSCNNSHRHSMLFKDINKDDTGINRVLSERPVYHNGLGAGGDGSKDGMSSVPAAGIKTLLHNNNNNNIIINNNNNNNNNNDNNRVVSSEIEEYDLESNYPYSSVGSIPGNSTTTTATTTDYLKAGDQPSNDVTTTTTKGREPQLLYQIIKQQRNEIELKQTLIKDLEQEIVSTEEALESKKEIAAYQSLSGSYEVELEEYEREDWHGLVQSELQNEQRLRSELAGHRQKLDGVQGRLLEVEGQITDLSQQLQGEVGKCEEEIREIRKKVEEVEAEDDGDVSGGGDDGGGGGDDDEREVVAAEEEEEKKKEGDEEGVGNVKAKRGLARGSKWKEERLKELNEQLKEVEKELREKEDKESELLKRVKDLNLKHLEKTSIGGTNSSPSDSGTVVLKLLEKHGRHDNHHTKDAGTSSLVSQPLTGTDDNSSGDGVWV